MSYSTDQGFMETLSINLWIYAANIWTTESTKPDLFGFNSYIINQLHPIKMSQSSDHTGSELPLATLSLWGDPPVATSTLTRFVQILQNYCCSAQLIAKQTIRSIGCSQDLNNCIKHLVMYILTISSQAEISKCDMVATNGVAHQVGKDFINRLPVMPRQQKWNVPREE